MERKRIRSVELDDNIYMYLLGMSGIDTDGTEINYAIAELIEFYTAREFELSEPTMEQDKIDYGKMLERLFKNLRSVTKVIQ